MRIAQQLVDFARANETEVLDLIERSALYHALAQLTHRHTHFVDDADVVGLRSLTGREPRARCADSGCQLSVRLGIARHDVEQRLAGNLSLTRALGVLITRIQIIGRESHAVDSRQRELGSRFPRW